MRYSSHLLDEAISFAETYRLKEERSTCAQVLYGFAKLIALEPTYASAMFSTEELASLEKVKQVLDYYDLDYQLIKVGMPLLLSGKNNTFDQSSDILDEILEKCDDEPSVITEIINATKQDLQVFMTGSSLTAIIEKSKDAERQKAHPETEETIADGYDEDDGILEKTADEEITERKKPLNPKAKRKKEISTTDGSDRSNTEHKGIGKTAVSPQSEGDLFDIITNTTRKLNLELLSKIIGQDDAIHKFVRGYFNSNYAAVGGINSPRAVFFLTGPAGVGKTYMASIAAEVLDAPSLSMDMREYAIPSSITEFAGLGTESRLLKFVRENPSGLIILDNVEECYISVLNAIAQILQSGKLFDPQRKEYISFEKNTIIMTSRLGRSIYDDPSAGKLSIIPQNIVAESLINELDDIWHGDLAVNAFCRGIESKDIIMFRNLRTRHLLSCIDRSIEGLSEATSQRYGFKCVFDPKIPALLLYCAPSIKDARTAILSSQRFIKSEFFEISGLKSSHNQIEQIKTILFGLNADSISDELEPLFNTDISSRVLVVCNRQLRECFCNSEKTRFIFAENLTEVKDAIAKDILFAIIDPLFGAENDNENLALEDSITKGLEIIYELEKIGFEIPVYIFDSRNELNDIDRNYLLRLGAVDVINKDDFFKMKKAIESAVLEEQLDRNCKNLIKRNGYISYKSSQRCDESDSSILHVEFYDLKMCTAISSGSDLSVLRDSERPETRFDDVIGAENAKNELKYFISYLKDPKAFVLSGGKPPKGVLLYGPPGTGKTMLARAMAGESNVSFIQTSATQFMDKYVGESERKIRDLFRRAKQYSPAIIFIDEIDAIGKERTGNASSQHTESMLNALLTEMDGFKVDPDNPVFVLAATNYGMSNDSDDPRKLDDALLRRFDNRILVDLPNRDERIRFINLRMNGISNKDISEDAIINIADRTTGQSLAILQNIIDLAFRNSIKNSSTLTSALLLDALEEFNYGERHEWTQDYYRSTAIHEAGHAVMAFLSGNTPSFATIVSRGSFGGYVQKKSEEHKPTQSKTEMLWNIRVSLAGRAAEKVFFGEDASINTGASSDLQSATRYALQMICSYGMLSGKMIALPVDTLLKTSLAQNYLDEANQLIEKEMTEAERLLSENKDKIELVANALLKENYLTSKQIEGILNREKS